MHRTILQLSTRFARFCARFRKDKSGGVLIYTGVMLPVLLGVSGLSVDVGLWYMNKRVLQAAADAAALGGALELRRSSNSAIMLQAATDSAAENGYSASGGDTLTVNNPPTAGSFAGQTNAVEAIVQRPAKTFLASLLFKGPVTVAARAVATAGTHDACVWALNPTEQGAIKVSGSAQVNMTCGIIANSNDPSAITQSGASCLTAANARAVGGHFGDCINPTPQSTNAVNDPLATMAPPNYGGCDYPGQVRANNGQTVTVTPGVYCNKITVQPGGTMNFDPGLYVLDGAALTIHGTATGTGVTFYLTEDTAQNDTITINSGANVSFSAPPDGDMPGVLFYQDRTSTAGLNHTFNGQANMALDGILYFSNADLIFAGGAVADPTSTVIIVDTITFTGDSEFGDHQGSPALYNPQLVTVTLVE